MTQEALKLSREALAELKDVEKQVRELVAENKALKEALAQTQEPWCMKMNGCKTKCEDCPDEPPQRTKQEPVAWMLDGEFYKTQQFHLQGGHYANQIPLYTAPPQRTWVGLTDEEVSEVFGGDIHAEHSGELRFVRAIEAKLREKNSQHKEKNT